MISSLLLVFGCGGSSDNGTGPIEVPAPSCGAASSGGSQDVAEPQLVTTLSAGGHEAWQGSPAVADLDGDGTSEIIVAREGLLVVWHLDGTEVFRGEVDGRIWASPVIGDFDDDPATLEVVAAARDKIYAWDATGNDLSSFPYTWRDEMRSLAAGDIDGDGRLEVVAGATQKISENGQRDWLMAINHDGSTVSGFPPNTTGAAGCDDACFVTQGYDQNLALGDVDGDNKVDILAAQDNAYISLHDGAGRAFDSAPIFKVPTKFSGIRMMQVYEDAQKGWGEDDANQGHFTNTGPAIADIDQDGVGELVLLGSVQNVGQDQRERGVALWVLENDGTRPADWIAPYHAPDFLAGLWDFDGTNVVGATNQVAVADIEPARPGLEMIFAGFDGRIHAVDSSAKLIWSVRYTSDDKVLTGGVIIADLSSDGVPEIVFNTYSPDDGKSELFVLDAGGGERHVVPLPGRGAMPVPTVADVDGDGQLEIVVSLKDGNDSDGQVQVFTVPGSSDNCLLWSTGRGNLRRDGFIPPS